MFLKYIIYLNNTPSFLYINTLLSSPSVTATHTHTHTHRLGGEEGRGERENIINVILHNYVYVCMYVCRRINIV